MAVVIHLLSAPLNRHHGVFWSPQFIIFLGLAAFSTCTHICRSCTDLLLISTPHVVFVVFNWTLDQIKFNCPEVLVATWKISLYVIYFLASTGHFTQDKTVFLTHLQHTFIVNLIEDCAIDLIGLQGRPIKHRQAEFGLDRLLDSDSCR